MIHGVFLLIFGFGLFVVGVMIVGVQGLIRQRLHTSTGIFLGYLKYKEEPLFYPVLSFSYKKEDYVFINRTGFRNPSFKENSILPIYHTQTDIPKVAVALGPRNGVFPWVLILMGVFFIALFYYTNPATYTSYIFFFVILPLFFMLKSKNFFVADFQDKIPENYTEFPLTEGVPVHLQKPLEYAIDLQINQGKREWQNRKYGFAGVALVLGSILMTLHFDSTVVIQPPPVDPALETQKTAEVIVVRNLLKPGTSGPPPELEARLENPNNVSQPITLRYELDESNMQLKDQKTVEVICKNTDVSECRLALLAQTEKSVWPIIINLAAFLMFLTALLIVMKVY